MILSGSAKVAGVMGWPISHSLSPRLHGYWIEQHDIDGAYVPLLVPPGGLAQALSVLPLMGFCGVNVTIPHKVDALSICHTVDRQAERVGAVNTIVVNDDGRLHGSNTDVFGFLENLRENSHWQADNGPVVLVGAGGAARAIAVGLLEAGATEIRIINRTRSRAIELAEKIGGSTIPILWEERAKSLEHVGLLVNATNLGMQDQLPLDLPLDHLPTEAIVNDIVYSPLETDLLKAARARGNHAVDGLGMLLHQARPGFEAWYGVRPKVSKKLRKFVLECPRE